MSLPSGSVNNLEGQVRPLLTASCHDVRYFATLLRGINFSNRAAIAVQHNGFTVSVEEARTMTGTAYVSADVFDEYEYRPDPPDPLAPAPSEENSSQSSSHLPESAEFEIPLNTLIECLNIFGTAGPSSLNSGSKFKKRRRMNDGSDNDGGNDEDRGPANGRIDQYFQGNKTGTGMRMSFAGPGYPLILILAEHSSGPTATCEITTFDPEPHLELPFESEEAVLKIILKSSWLRDALSELDPSCEKLTFVGNPLSQGNKAPRATSQPLFRIQAAGTFGSTEMDYPNDREVLETFNCEKHVKFSYRFAHISKTLRALQSSVKTSLRIDGEGLMSLQFLMPSPRARDESSSLFVEFRCLALDDQL